MCISGILVECCVNEEIKRMRKEVIFNKWLQEVSKYPNVNYFRHSGATMSLMATIASLNGDFNFGVTDYIKIAQQHQASKNHSESSLRNFLMQAIKDGHFVALDNPLKKTRKTLVLSDTLKKEYRNWLNSLSKKFAA